MILKTTEEEANRIASLIFNTKLVGISKIDGRFFINITDNNLLEKYRSYLNLEQTYSLVKYINPQDDDDENATLFKFSEHDKNIFNILREEKLKRILQK